MNKTVTYSEAETIVASSLVYVEFIPGIHPSEETVVGNLRYVKQSPRDRLLFSPYLTLCVVGLDRDTFEELFTHVDDTHCAPRHELKYKTLIDSSIVCHITFSSRVSNLNASKHAFIGYILRQPRTIWEHKREMEPYTGYVEKELALAMATGDYTALTDSEVELIEKFLTDYEFLEILSEEADDIRRCRILNVDATCMRVKYQEKEVVL